MTKDSHIKCIGIVGLGYVGLPLAEAFAPFYSVVGHDVDARKVRDLTKSQSSFAVSSDPSVLERADVVIITVPTPVTPSKEPDLSYVIGAAGIVGAHLKKGAIVVLESTVYPGVTEEIVGRVLAKASGMVCGKDFTVGYSPERVNPGDPEHTIDKITKIVSGQDARTTKILADMYRRITKVYVAENIQTAEAAKVIENIQRDLNIALVNELALIFEKMGLDTHAVLQAAGTKWNFHRYTPGLVGGHCIPVDPYYLVHKAKLLGYHPQVILAGRAVNDSMPRQVFDLTLKALNSVKKPLNGSNILVLGLTFKENVPDTRENPVREVIRLLKDHGCTVYGYDPLLSPEMIEGFTIDAVADMNQVRVDAVILTVVHDAFKTLKLTTLKKMMKKPGILIDVRGFFDKEQVAAAGIIYQTL
ncbi:MAG: nucleotide sugar dehydrogenase [Candidatus Thermoplasmatota archaeon]|nr:nucleotide sugar dehydrogenase [Candidatus Thermoplasmatota archaeon]MBU1940579.1 nucleotide sugar dehydrogenase [Candidatus Thermoplasmatota archaeon]